LGVAVVWIRSLNLREEILVEEKLADMAGLRRGGIGAEEGAVEADGSVIGVVRKNVDVGGAACGFLVIPRILQ